MAGQPTEIPLENILLFDANGKYTGTAADAQKNAANGTNSAKGGSGFLSFLSGLSTAVGPLLSSLFPNGIGGGATSTTTTGPGGIQYVQQSASNNSDSNILLIGAALVGIYFLTQDKPKRRKRY